MPEYQLEIDLRLHGDGSKHDHSLPTPHNYAATYTTVVQTLRNDIYKAIDVGLSTQSPTRGIFSLHDGAHFDEVVRKASEIANYAPANYNKDIDGSPLSVYEMFVLLLAIRVHDAGNYSGRTRHEQRCLLVLEEVAQPLLPFKGAEASVIADIAAAHGGELPGGDKDKIGALEPKSDVGGARIRTHRIAALVRISDELAENMQRTYPCLLRNRLIPKANEVYHYYAQSIKANGVDKTQGGICVRLSYVVSFELARKKLGKDTKTIYLIDEIRQRLHKMNQERVYCNRFLAPSEQITSIVASVKVLARDGTNVGYAHDFILRDEGYPSELKLPLALQRLNQKIVQASLSHSARKVGK